MALPNKMSPRNRRSLEMAAIQLEATADGGIEKLGVYPHYTEDRAARKALDDAAKVLRRAVLKDSLL